jgi:hypothetical protein
MNVKDCHEFYYFYTGKVSDIVRQLGLAGIAIVWLFKSEAGGRIVLPNLLVWAAVLVLAGLVVDLLQYVAGSLCWGFYGRCKDRAKVPEEEFRAPGWINTPAIACLMLKVPLILAAYVFIFIYLGQRLSY